MRRLRLVAVACLAAIAIAAWWLTSSLPESLDPGVVEGAHVPGAEPAPLAGARVTERPTALEQVAAAEVDATPGPETEPAIEAERVRLVGRLVDAADATPLADERLRFLPRYGRGDVYEVTTDESGRFELDAAASEIVAVHEPRPEDVARDLEPRVFDLTALRDSSGNVDVTIRAQAPPLVLKVELMYEDGAPAVGALVSFSAKNPELLSVDPWTRAGADGVAHIGIWFPYAFEHGQLRAEDDSFRVSELLDVEAPLEPYPRRLVLRPGGTVEVFVLHADGVPVAGRQVMVVHSSRWSPSRYDWTDANGMVVLAGLFAGESEVIVRDGHLRKSILVRTGGHERVDFELPAAGVRTAVSGRVVDERGAPLKGVSLVVTPSGEWPRRVTTDAQGRFECPAAPCESVHVTANLTAEGDRFDPDERTVPYGTRDVEFHRIEKARIVRFDMVVVDRESGERMDDFAARIDRGQGTERHDNGYAGRRSFELRVLPESRWHVAAKDHLTKTLRIAEALAALGEGEVLRVELERGLEHELVVLDAETGAPLEGVVLRSPTAGEARTDAAGRVRVSADHWSVYSVHKDGFESTTFDPEDHVLWRWGPLHLERRP